MSQFIPGQPQPPGAGRKPGTLNKATLAARRMAEEMGCDPLRVLLHFTQGNAATLGLPTQQLEDGTTVQVPVPLDMRLQASQAAVAYLYPKLKAIEATHEVTQHDAFMSLPEDERHRRLRHLEVVPNRRTVWRL
ncbi:Hypothetical protein RMHFA_05563 (plasmid) [Roseomonas mucosa]|uniref:hypothetical protein n=1 Tax=Roseomonas TaxID=125216 RepID=UPI000C1A168A|nr:MULTISPECIES: hypothetical protein [Roseomonas]ATR19137.1 hypothetical protein CTJ15_01770 [Roseomonas sp. FDAARGOS_362]UZO99345.1 Hypothetical protein RMHFA_05563 [Roseomonas mucosa]